MKINNWFDGGCKYNEGVLLYASLNGHSVNLVRLFLRKESIANAEKLAYELGKFREAEDPSVKYQEPRTKIQTPTPVVAKHSSGGFYRINELPTELHPLLIEQSTNYKLACSLHLQLTALHPDEEGAALKLCIMIEDLFDAIETSQKVLDYYKKHKVVLNIKPRSFEDLTPAQLIQTRSNKKATISKHKKKVEVLKKQFGQKLSKSDSTKLKIAFEKAERTLLQHEYEAQELTNLINEK